MWCFLAEVPLENPLVAGRFWPKSGSYPVHRAPQEAEPLNSNDYSTTVGDGGYDAIQRAAAEAAQYEEAKADRRSAVRKPAQQ